MLLVSTVIKPQPAYKEHIVANAHSAAARQTESGMSPQVRITLEPIGEGPDAPIVITDGEFRVGRREAPFAEQDAIRASRLSRQHARIFERDGQAFAADLGSLNGTFVNHEKLGREPLALQTGDEIDFGGKFQFAVSVETTAPDDVTVFEDAAAVELQLVPETADLPTLSISRFPFLITRNLEAFQAAKDRYADAFAQLSRRQAMLTLVGNRVCVEDLASANGTYLDGVAVQSVSELQDGQLLRFGDERLAYRVRVRDLDEDRTVVLKQETPSAPQRPTSLADNELLRLDVEMLARQGFVTSGDAQQERVQEFRRIKRQVLQNVEAVHEESQVLPRNLVLVTSSLAGEGKTFVAANLALSLAAELDYHVLLVDADPAQGELSRLLGMHGKEGFVDRLARGDASADSCILRTNIEHLHLLPCGSLPGHLDELYASALMRRMLLNLAVQDARRIVIFDGPPVLASTEAAVLARQMGQTLMVVEAGETPQNAVKDAVGRLSGCQDLGLLLNKVDPR